MINVHCLELAPSGLQAVREIWNVYCSYLSVRSSILIMSKLAGTVTPVLGMVRSLSVVISKPVHHAFRVVAVLPQFGPTFVIVWRRTSPESSGSVTPRTHGAHASRATATCLNEGNMVKGKDKGWVLEKKILQKNVVKSWIPQARKLGC